jgi:hypothetical protein
VPVVLFEPIDKRRRMDTRAKKSVDGGEYADTWETSWSNVLMMFKGIKAGPAAVNVFLAEVTLPSPSARNFYREAPFESVIVNK